MAEISDIVQKLVIRSVQGRVDWQKTVDENAYFARFSNASVSINKSSFQGYSLKIRNQEGRDLVELSEQDDKGRECQAQLKELYNHARSIALGVDSQLDKLLQELEADA